MSAQSAIRLEPWGNGDLPLLQKTMGDAAMTEHLGGPESPEKLAQRQIKYERLADSGKGRMFKIVDEATGDAIGSVGYWTRIWRDGDAYEIGWSVIPGFQGRGVARSATEEAISTLRSEAKHRFLHAFPSIDNAPSNSICRRLGFTLIEECDIEFPPGNLMRCNDWQLDLFASP